MKDIFKIRGDRPAARIQEIFEKEATKRPRDFDEEVLAVWRATNEERLRIGKGPLPLSEVEIVQRMAQGHIDYSSKLGLYCEDLVYRDFKPGMVQLTIIDDRTRVMPDACPFLGPANRCNMNQTAHPVCVTTKSEDCPLNEYDKFIVERVQKED